jgi:hypothetical protein
VLFYSYADALKGRHMIATSAEENNTAREVVDASLDALNAMVRTHTGLGVMVICAFHWRTSHTTLAVLHHWQWPSFTDLGMFE